MKIKVESIGAFIFLVITCVVVVACNKDKYTTKPQITFKSVNTTTVQRGQALIFRLEFTDKEGDLSGSASAPDSMLMVQKITRNCEQSNNIAYYKLPEFPEMKNSKGEIVVSYAYGVGFGYPPLFEPQCAFNDTCVFRFILKDRHGNVSDTATSPEIVLIKG
jgi:hypothetical protein